MPILFYYGRLSSVQLDCWPAPMQRPTRQPAPGLRNDGVYARQPQ